MLTNKLRYLIKLKLKVLTKSSINNGVEILKKKKCHVHNGQAERRLLLIKNIKKVINENLVNIFSFFENKKK